MRLRVSLALVLALPASVAAAELDLRLTTAAGGRMRLAGDLRPSRLKRDAD